MRINSSITGMESARSYSAISTRAFGIAVTAGQLSLGGRMFGGRAMGSQPEGKQIFGGRQTNGNWEETAGEEKEENTNAASLSDQMEEMRARLNGFSPRVSFRTPVSASAGEVEQLRSIRQQCLDFFYNMMFGSVKNYRNVGTGGQSSGFSQMAPFSGFRTLEYQQRYTYTETEATSFSTQGTVKCADGREIDFNVNLQMSRSFQEYYEESYTALEYNVCDPLVINLDGNIAELSDQTVLFDIDSDGVKDNVSRLGSGSGYLALDQNNDGQINNGSELFGTASGNGFADLAQYDSDGNGWIDEGDAIWAKLKIWVMDENGEGQLYGLAEKGLGAINLAHAGTEFALTDENNAAKGFVRQSGMFLYESGAVGSVQQVDLVKYDQVS